MLVTRAMPNLIYFDITVIGPRGVQFVDQYLCFAIICLGSVTYIPLADDTHVFLVSR